MHRTHDMMEMSLNAKMIKLREINLQMTYNFLYMLNLVHFNMENTEQHL